MTGALLPRLTVAVSVAVLGILKGITIEYNRANSVHAVFFLVADSWAPLAAGLVDKLYARV